MNWYFFSACQYYKRLIVVHDARFDEAEVRYPDTSMLDSIDPDLPAWHRFRSQEGFGAEYIGHFEAMLPCDTR